MLKVWIGSAMFVVTGKDAKGTSGRMLKWVNQH
ncbi:hypothetical protein LDDCCGHA_3664 [Methylobacterium oxalidis]|nr:hypothetical protein LDDCCGHA_3664 [Methylobacterium oxalidis]